MTVCGVVNGYIVPKREYHVSGKEAFATAFIFETESDCYQYFVRHHWQMNLVRE